MTQSDYRQKVMRCVWERQLSSVMNHTKWSRLQQAVLNDLPFAPPYQVKYVCEDTVYPATFDEDVWYLGDWMEGLEPFYAVEWIRVRPRYQRHRGNLVAKEVIDISEAFSEILRVCNVPYVEQDDSIYIYGYISGEDIKWTHK